METQLKNIFLELLRCGIKGEEPVTSLFEGLDEQAWISIYRTVCKQTVIGVCIQTVYKLPPRLRPPQELFLKWMGQNVYIEARSKKMLHAWEQLNQRLSSENIHPILMKGLSLAASYATPTSRQASDIDIYIPDEFSKAVKLIQQWGYATCHKPQHDSFDYEGVHIEMHPELIAVPFKPFINCTPMDVYIQDTLLRVPDVNTGSLLILSHAAKHFLMEGIGYRYLCDWAAYLGCYHTKIHTDLVLAEAKRMGMLRFVVEFTEAAHRELKLSFPGIDKWLQGSKKKYVDILIDVLLESGDFGAINFKSPVRNFQERRTHWLHLLKRRHFWPRLFWRKFIKRIYIGNMIHLFPTRYKNRQYH